MNGEGLRRACVKTAISTRRVAFDFSQWENRLGSWSDLPCNHVSSVFEKRGTCFTILIAGIVGHIRAKFKYHP